MKNAPLGLLPNGVFFLETMVVIKSKITGYCHGVEKTIRNALNVLKKAQRLELPAYSIGTLIHNNDVVNAFEERGLRVIDNPSVKPGVALVRAHGIAESEKQEYLARGFVLVDSTCENIIKTKHGIADAEQKKRSVVVIGVKDHAETNTLLGCSDRKKYLVTCMEDLAGLFKVLDADSPVSVAVQTTFSEQLYGDISKALFEHYSDIAFVNRLCAACTARKSKGLQLACECDVVFVVGGAHSSNTRELASWIGKSGKPVFCIENVKSIDDKILDEIKGVKVAGVCSGTSTPSVIIEEVCEYLRSLN